MKKRQRRKMPTVTHAGINIRMVRENYYMVDIFRDKKRERKCFDDLAQAKTYCDILDRKIGNEGTSVLDLTTDQRKDAMKALKILTGDSTLEGCATFWRLHHPRGDAVTVEMLVDIFMESLSKRNARESTIAEREQKFKRLVNDLGDRPAASIAESNIVQWLDDKGLTGQTRDGYRRAFNALFNLGVKKEIVIKNPCSHIERALKDQTDPRFFTASQTRDLMAMAESREPCIVPFLALQFFAGLRPGEAAGMDWSKVDFTEKKLTVDSATSKKRRRRVIEFKSLPDEGAALTAWLLPYRQTQGPMGRDTKPQRAASMNKIARLAKVDWIQDGARHSFASMAYAVKPDPVAIASVMGNSSGIVLDHYRGLATVKEAARYWAIVPHEESNVIQLEAGA
ncbi:MAG: tyrosine-type recombinase/integrase [Lentisphaerota bacterium]